jgi:hypothetical protein
MDYNQISPNAFSNQNTIGGVFGQAMPGTFNRNIGASESQMTVDPLTGRTIDPTLDQSASAPVPPPTGVQTNITPNYDLNTQ